MDYFLSCGLDDVLGLLVLGDRSKTLTDLSENGNESAHLIVTF